MPVGAHGIAVCADIEENELNLKELDGVVLPGGMPGTTNLEASDVVQKAVACAVANNLLVAAICAAPSVLGHGGYLRNKKATCYPGFEGELSGATVLSAYTVTDGKIITATGAGAAVPFGGALVSVLCGDAVSKELLKAFRYTDV